jgi:hypothetical protein
MIHTRTHNQSFHNIRHYDDIQSHHDHICDTSHRCMYRPNAHGVNARDANYIHDCHTQYDHIYTTSDLTMWHMLSVLIITHTLSNTSILFHTVHLYAETGPVADCVRMLSGTHTTIPQHMCARIHNNDILCYNISHDAILCLCVCLLGTN